MKSDFVSSMRAWPVRCLLLLAIALPSATALAFDDDYPNRPVRLIVPFAPGGPTDVVARLLAEALADSLKQPVVVDNRGGAGGAIGTGSVAQARPDGYTIGLATASTHEFTPACQRAGSYEPVNDFAMIGLVSTSPTLIYVSRDSRFVGLTDILAASRREPGAITWGTAGVCSNTHFLVELINRSARARITPVPYRGNSAASTDLIAGHITLASDAVTPASIGLIASGAVRPVAIIGHSELAILQRVPSLTELGVDVAGFTVWQGLVAPAGTPGAVIRRLNDALGEALANPQLQRRWREDGIAPATDSRPEALRQRVEIGYARARELVVELGIQPQ